MPGNASDHGDASEDGTTVGPIGCPPAGAACTGSTAPQRLHKRRSLALTRISEGSSGNTMPSTRTCKSCCVKAPNSPGEDQHLFSGQCPYTPCSGDRHCCCDAQQPKQPALAIHHLMPCAVSVMSQARSRREHRLRAAEVNERANALRCRTPEPKTLNPKPKYHKPLSTLLPTSLIPNRRNQATKVPTVASMSPKPQRRTPQASKP